MPSVLLLVFVLQLTIHLLNNIGKQTINEVLWLLFTRLPTSQSKEAQELPQLRREVVRLNREMNATSPQDAFAQWAKLRRQHDKAKEKYDAKARDQTSLRTTFDRVVNALRWIGTQGLNFMCNMYYAKQAMFWLPQGWVPYQVEWILSFPRAPLGSVSINVWGIACASVIGMVTEGVIAVWTLRAGEVKEGSRKGEKVVLEKPVMADGAGEKTEL